VLRFTATGGPLMIVQPSGKPISRHTHEGLSGADALASASAASPGVLRARCDGPAVAFCAAFTVGVGQSTDLTAVCNPICAFFPSGRRPVEDVPTGTVRDPVTSPTDGVGQTARTCVRRRCCVSGITSPEAHRAAHSGEPIRPASSTVGESHVRTAVRRFRPPSRPPFPGPPVPSAVVAVGQQEEALSPVRRAHVACAETVPRRIEPERGQVTEHFREGVPVVSGKEPRDVLHEHEARSHVSNDPAILAPEARPLARESCALSGEADVLAGEAAAEDVDSRESVDGADVVISNSVRPVLCENVTTPRIPFHLEHHSPARGVLDAKLQPADA
jgi:hypothetical protein